jgi:hypothetical protein
VAALLHAHRVLQNQVSQAWDERADMKPSGTQRDETARTVSVFRFGSVQPVRLAERVHQPVSPTKNCDGVDKIDDLEVVHTDLT